MLVVAGSAAACGGSTHHDRPVGPAPTLHRQGLPLPVLRRAKLVVTVVDGVAYIGNAGATIRAISMRFGRVLWRHDTQHGKMASSPAVVGRDLVYHSMDGHVYVLDRGTGRLRWQYWIDSPIESSPIVHGGIDYFGAWNGRLYALDLRT